MDYLIEELLAAAHDAIHCAESPDLSPQARARSLGALREVLGRVDGTCASSTALSG